MVEMVYNPPATGHVVMILDNGTTAMTGLQENPATGRTLEHAADRQGGVGRVGACRWACPNVHVVDPNARTERFGAVDAGGAWRSRSSR